MIRNTPATLADFAKSDLWQDIVDELDSRIEVRRQELEDPDGNLNVDMVYRIQGGIKAYREVRDNLLESLVGMASERT